MKGPINGVRSSNKTTTGLNSCRRDSRTNLKGRASQWRKLERMDRSISISSLLILTISVKMTSARNRWTLLRKKLTNLRTRYSLLSFANLAMMIWLIDLKKLSLQCSSLKKCFRASITHVLEASRRSARKMARCSINLKEFLKNVKTYTIKNNQMNVQINFPRRKVKN